MRKNTQPEIKVEMMYFFWLANKDRNTRSASVRVRARVSARARARAFVSSR